MISNTVRNQPSSVASPSNINRMEYHISKLNRLPIYRKYTTLTLPRVVEQKKYNLNGWHINFPHASPSEGLTVFLKTL